MNTADSIQFVRAVAAIQSIYFLLTGLWPLVHLRSFLAVTGPKDDIWLVETVGLLVSTFGAGLGLAAFRGRVTAELAVVAVTSALALAIVDSLYVFRGRIAPIYLLDVVVEGILIVAWATCWRAQIRRRAARQND